MTYEPKTLSEFVSSIEAFRKELDATRRALADGVGDRDAADRALAKAVEERGASRSAQANARMQHEQDLADRDEELRQTRKLLAEAIKERDAARDELARVRSSGFCNCRCSCSYCCYETNSRSCLHCGRPRRV